MKKGVVIMLFIVGILCLLFQQQLMGVNAIYIKTLGIVFIMFSVYKIANKVTSKTDGKPGNFKF